MGDTVEDILRDVLTNWSVKVDHAIISLMILLIGT